MFSNQFACVRSLLVKHRTDCPPLLRRFSIAFPLSLPPRCHANTKRPPPHPPRRPATTLFGHGDGDDRVVGCAPAGLRYRYVTLFKRKNLLFVVVIGFGALWNREEGLSLQNNQYKNNNTNDAEYS